jgi:NDP-4-keto-2,6-dideoxyhexose 3-C-methyltransferase
MKSFRRIDACRICGNTALEPVLSLGNQYLTGVFSKATDEKLTCGPLTLVRCSGGPEACGLVQLEHSYNSSEMYGDRYGYRSSLNSSMVEHLRGKIGRLVAAAAPSPGDVVLDIGSNDGTSLSFYPDSLTRVGMDPTADMFSHHYKPDVHRVADFFSAKRFDAELGGRKAKVVTSIAMFYDLDEPLEFISQVRSVMVDDGIWHFEQSYMPRMLETTGYDTICHEHLEYYALAQVEWMMKRSGLRIIDVELNDANGGSFAVTVCKTDATHHARPNRKETILADENQLGLDSSRPFEDFAARVEQHRRELPELLDRLRDEGALTLGYGASTKGNVMLQYCGIGPSSLPFIAEVNHEKFGCFTPGTCIPIISEDEAHALNPDYLLAMPWHFRRNLVEREAAFLNRGGKMIFPLPHIQVLDRSTD